MAKLNNYISDFDRAYSYVRDNYHQRWRDYLKAYRGIRTKIAYNGYSDAFVPETHTIIESIKANIAGGTQRFEYYPTNEDQQKETDVLTERADYVMACNKGGILKQNWADSMLKYGTGVIHIGWWADKMIPKLSIVPLFDFIFDPTATCLEDADYAGYRYLTSWDSLKSEMVTNPKTGRLNKKYSLRESDKSFKSNEGTDGSDQTDKNIKEEILHGSTLGVNDNQVEIIRLYYRPIGDQPSKMIEIINRKRVIYEVEKPLEMPERKVTREVQTIDPNTGEMTVIKVKGTVAKVDPFLPFAVLRDYIDSSMFLGTGEIETIHSRQEQLNDVENQDLDNMSYVNNTMFTIDPQFADMIPEIENQPGAVYALPKGALSVIEKGQISQDVDYKKKEIKDEMRRATAADEIIQGASNESGRQTATEVTSIVSQANTRFATKINNLEAEGFAQLADAIRKMDQIFLTEETSVRVKTDKGIEFKSYDPAMFSGDYEPHVKLETTLQKVEMDKAQKMQSLATLLMGNPVVNQEEAVRMILKDSKIKEEDINKLLTLPPPTMPGMMPGMMPGETPQQGGAPSGAPTDAIMQAMMAQQGGGDMTMPGDGDVPAGLPQQALAGMGNAQ